MSSLTLTQQALDLTALGAAFTLAAALASPGAVGTVTRSVFARESHVFVSLVILLLAWSVCLAMLWLNRVAPALRWRGEFMEVVKAVSLCMLILSTAELVLEWQTVNK